VSLRPALLSGAALLALGGVGALLLLAPYPFPLATVVGACGFSAGLAVTAYAAHHAAGHPRGSAAVWLDLAPATAALLWSGASALQSLTAAVWSAPFALAAQLLAATICVVVTFAARVAAARTRVEELEYETRDALEEPSFDARLQGALIRARVADDASEPSTASPRPLDHASASPVRSGRSEPPRTSKGS
jgi:hypothetical protein